MQDISAEIAAIVVFFTKLPARLTGVPSQRLADTDLARAARFTPLAGVVVAIAGIATIATAQTLGLAPLVAVIAGMAAMMALTGCLHEDGLADVADALGAATPERRLDIMRDSRIGTYGATALWLALSLRAALLHGLLSSGSSDPGDLSGLGGLGGLGIAAGALIGAHALSRMAALYLLYALPPARGDGASAAFGRPDAQTFIQGVLIACVVAVLTLPAAGGFAGTLAALAACTGIALAMKRFAMRGFGGQTGDLIGATQQLSELALLATIAIFV